MNNIYLIAKPEGVDERLWIEFINTKCSNCEDPKNGCTEVSAVIGQAKKCYQEWLAQRKS